jgi:galactokinase
VDYSGYAVLPMALENDSLLAVAIDKESPYVEIASIEPERFTSKTFNKNPAELEFDQHHWSKYILAGYKVSGYEVHFRLKLTNLT